MRSSKARPGAPAGRWRRWGGGAVEAGLGELPAVQLVAQREADHAAGEAVGHVGAAAGAGQHDHGVEGLGVVGEVAELALGGGDGFVEEVAGLQGVQRCEVVAAPGGRPVARLRATR
jgi:hypothetical protein